MLNPFLKKTLPFLGVALAATLSIELNACAEVGLETNENGIKVISSFDSLPECTEEIAYEIYFVQDSMAAYVCLNSKWTVLKDETYASDEICDAQDIDLETQVCIDFGILEKCTSTNDGAVQEHPNGGSYYCKSGTWTKMNEMEAFLGETCSATNKDSSKTYGFSKFVCNPDSTGWLYDTAGILYDTLEYGGQKYKTVGIGDQMWFAENLNYQDEEKTPNLKDGHLCYDKKAENCEVEGSLYTWTAAMNLPAEYGTKPAGDLIKSPHQGICPDGWHIPAIKDWDALRDFVIRVTGVDDDGTHLKSVDGWQEKDGFKGTNLFGFNGKAVGNITAKGTSSNRSVVALFIVADEIECTYDHVDKGTCLDFISPVRADLRYSESAFRYLQSELYPRTGYTSIRCVKD